MSTLWLDLETFSKHDLSVVGVHRYCELGCHILLFAYALDEGPARVWQAEREPMPADLRVWLSDATELVAHNAAFDRTVLESLGLVEHDLTRWTCTMAVAHTLSLPGGLGPLCRALRVEEEESKVRDGKRLLRKFTRPRKPTKNNPATRWTWKNAPEDWDRFVHYARMDVEAMRTCSQKMPRWNFEPRIWAMDQDMNDRGVGIDLDLCAGATKVALAEQERLNRRMTEVTQGRVEKPTQRERIRVWLASRGLVLPNLTRDTLEAAVARPGLSEEVRTVVMARLESSRSTAAKYAAMSASANADGRARGCYQYAGAGQTMRWAGRRIQFQNLFRPLIDCHEAAESLRGLDLLSGPESLEAINLLWRPLPPLDVVASAVRGALVASPGHSFSVWDLSQIEARFTFWFARGLKMLAAFADPSRDPYTETARDIGSDARQLGKALVLACGFGMGPERFQETAAKPPYYLDLTMKQAESYVYGWREANPEVPCLWREVESSAARALRERKRIKHTATGLRFAFERIAGFDCLTIQLPTKHRLVYWGAKLQPDGSITYCRWFKDGFVPEYHIWGGGFVENIVQMAARHLMAGALYRTEMHVAPVVGTVHDEGLAEVPDEELEEKFRRMGEEFERVPSWAKDLGGDGPTLPLAAEGYITKRYKK